MMHRTNLTLALGVVLATLAGCQNQAVDLTAAMEPVERPVEMEALDYWVGQWTSSGTAYLPDGQTMDASGTANNSSEAGGFALLERMEWSMGEQVMSGCGTWTWNGSDYDIVWFSSVGDVVHGKGSYDAASRTWSVTGTGKNHHNGRSSRMQGTATAVDDNTVAWEHIELDMWGNELMKMTGTNTRVTD